ncbi:hypothetical protein ACGFNU_35650 [Spirillospora sp. NPDC048911]|uniref:hypothetical protein n=1 Tax=Spirillospora sp. NPDC048911 TaxID=3364527 RepID=UPI00371A8EFD
MAGGRVERVDVEPGVPLMFVQHRVHKITVRTDGDEVALPAALCGWHEPRPAELPYERVVAALSTAGLGWELAPELVLDDDAIGVRVVRSGVEMLFASDREDGDQPRLWRIWTDAQNTEM